MALEVGRGLLRVAVASCVWRYRGESVLVHGSISTCHLTPSVQLRWLSFLGNELSSIRFTGNRAAILLSDFDLDIRFFWTVSDLPDFASNGVNREGQSCRLGLAVA